MTYSVSCECGNSIEATATQAGTLIPCSCGRSIGVPLLSQLRQMAGQGAYEAGTIDAINRMIREGKLPLGDICAISGLPTKDSYDLYVQCESTWVNGPGATQKLLTTSFTIFATLFSPFRMLGWLLLGKSRPDEEAREMGRNRGVFTPLRVRQEHQQQLCQTSQRKLRQLLRSIPIYATLLDEYPNARIKV